MDKNMHWSNLKFILPDEHYEALLQYCSGYTIKFSKAEIEAEEIRNKYKKLRDMNMTKPTAVKVLSTSYAKSVNRIYEIVKDV